MSCCILEGDLRFSTLIETMCSIFSCLRKRGLCAGVGSGVGLAKHNVETTLRGRIGLDSVRRRSEPVAAVIG